MTKIIGFLISKKNPFPNIDFFELMKNKLLTILKIGGLLHKIGFKNNYLNSIYDYYCNKSYRKEYLNELSPHSTICLQ